MHPDQAFRPEALRRLREGRNAGDLYPIPSEPSAIWPLLCLALTLLGLGGLYWLV